MTRSWTLCHTSDWHLGHALHGRSRQHEHAAFLGWLERMLEERSVDALIVAGDVFDTASPSGSAQAAFFELLAGLRRRRPSIDVLVIAGNHDSPSRLAAPDAVLRSLGVRLVGAVPWVGQGRAQRIDAEALVVPLHAHGEVVAQVAAVPYLRAGDLPALAEGEEDDDPALRIARGAKRVYDQVADAARARLGKGQVLIATGHCHVAGAALSDGSERAVVGGLAGALPIDVFPADAAYVALGHLHLAQEVAGRAHVRYAGSPIPLALAEDGYAHEVRLVTFQGSRLVSQASCRVPREVGIVRVPRDGPAPLEDVLDALRSLELGSPQLELGIRRRVDREHEERWPWLEVRVRLARPEPALRARIDQAMAGLPLRLVKITVEHDGPERGTQRPEQKRELAELDVRDVFLRRWSLAHEGAPPPDVLAAFDEACASVEGGSDAAGSS